MKAMDLCIHNTLQKSLRISRPIKESPDFHYFAYNNIINHIVSHINPIIREFSLLYRWIRLKR